MKKIILVLLLAVASRHCVAQVNSLDTLVFDISQAVTIGSYVEVPVLFLSDDSIVALDFSFKYNHTNFTCDSIIDLTTYLQELWYYNANDSIMRFTSYNLQNIPNNTSVVKVRFNTLSGQLCSSDLNTVKGYLNGDACSINVVDCIPNGIVEAGEKSMVKVYPNPAFGELVIQSQKSAKFVLYDVYGKLALSGIHTFAGGQIKVVISTLAQGVYFLCEESFGYPMWQKIVIKK